MLLRTVAAFKAHLTMFFDAEPTSVNKLARQVPQLGTAESTATASQKEFHNKHKKRTLQKHSPSSYKNKSIRSLTPQRKSRARYMSVESHMRQWIVGACATRPTHLRAQEQKYMYNHS